MIHYNLKSLGRGLCIGAILIFLIISASLLEQRFPFKPPLVNKEDSSINLKPAFYQVFTLGYSRLLSSSLWIATLLESDIEHYKGDSNSWMYYRFLTISKLEPRFYLNYLFGGQYLSIIKDDVNGADALYRDGLKYYSTDFWLNYHAGFNATFEMGNTELGLEYYKNIENHPRVATKHPFIFSIIQRLKISQGQLSLTDAYEIISKTIPLVESEYSKQKMKKTLYAIKAEMDLDCLNHLKKSCARLDFEGQPYTFDGKIWRAPRQWSPYRFLEKKKAPQ